MNQEEGPNDALELVGLPVAEATEAVLARDDSRDPETVRATLETVAKDGVVSREGVRDSLAELSKVVSTPETRVEFAAIELAEARATAEAEGVDELDTVRARVEGYQARLDDIEERIGGLGPELRDLVDQCEEPGGVYEVAAGVPELRERANELQLAADELQRDAETFGRWLTTPEVRYDELEEELGAIEASFAELTDAVDALAASTGEASGDEPATPVNPGATWADATFQTRVLELLVVDLRVELADLRAWPTPEAVEGDATERVEEFDDRLDEFDERCATLSERLGDLARPAWSERFGPHAEGFEEALAAFEPPVPWGEVEAALERHRADLEG